MSLPRSWPWLKSLHSGKLFRMFNMAGLTPIPAGSMVCRSACVNVTMLFGLAASRYSSSPWREGSPGAVRL